MSARAPKTGEHETAAPDGREVRDARDIQDGLVPSDAREPSGAREPVDARVTPMIAQFLDIKAGYPDALLFYRMGDFYELFFDDAAVASRTLGIVLTRRGKHAGADIPMCGVPVERSDEYLHKLIAAGHRVAVCEQTEDPAEARRRGGKSVVRRAVVRLVTPGTLTEERLLDPARPNLLVALSRRRGPEDGWCYGLAAVDISTGRFSVADVDGAGLAAELARIDPREIVVPDVIYDDPGLKTLWRDANAAVTPLPRDGLDPDQAERRLKGFYEVASLDAYGDFSRSETAAAGMALAYVERTQIASRPALAPPRRDGEGGCLLIDPATRANLELVRGQRGDRAGSLLEAVDRTVTAAGARLLAERVAGPLADADAIGRRQDGVAALVEARDLRDGLRDALAAAPDMARALARLGLGRGGPRDLACLRDGLAASRAVAAALRAAPERPGELADAVAALDALDGDLGPGLAAALADDLPVHRRDGGFVRDGYDPDLDELRLLARDSRRVIATLQARYATETECRTLRVKHNGLIGYFVEVPAQTGEILAAGDWRRTFVHRQTMSGAMRFTTAELGELESRIASAADRAVAREGAHFDRLAAELGRHGDAIRAAADGLAILDVTASLADLAADLRWTRPRLTAGAAFAVRAARHPVVEAALARAGEPFIANDCTLGDAASARILLVTGPNMGGKSTFLRQNALLVVLAQMGSFVPAEDAAIGIVDRLFSRVGAADDLARGRSTFMVEMVETAAILNQATPRSLVVLDEIGRGTATFDGLSIAWAAIEHLHETNRCRALFATHYHELTALADRLPRLSNATLRVTDWDGDVVFLHEVVPGAADRSYGLQVAKLAGLPPPVVARARAILTEFERTDREKPRAALLDELPLFAAARPLSAPVTPPTRPAPDRLRETLAALDPDGLTPRKALEALYGLKALLKP